MKLRVKILLLVIIILLVTGVVSGGAMLYWQRRAHVAQFEHMAIALANAVQGSLEQGMMLGERQHIQEAMVRVGQEEMVSAIAIFSPDGAIAASGEISEIGQATEADEILKVLQSGQAATLTDRQDGLTELRIIIPIFNKAECQTCHSSATTALGAIQVSLDTTPLDNQIKRQTIFFGTFGVVTLLVIGVGLAFTLRKLILTPLSKLAESAQGLSQGTYSIRARIGAQDEIGMLARSFNEMAQNVEQRNQELEASHQELARWNLDLESKIQQRTKELEEVNKIREQLLEKLISAQEEERRRIARELHDEASQSLAAVVLHLEDIADNLPTRYSATKRRLDMLKERIVQTLEGMRNLALELRPSILDHLGLPRAIEWYAKDYLSKSGLEANIDIAIQKIKLPSYTESMLFRIAQEALTNVVKHARASQVTVKLQLSGSKISLQIEDNGIGFDVDTALSGIAGQKNLGLHGMMERATLLGGTLDIRSEPGRGTRLKIEAPLMEGANTNEQD